MAVSSNCLRQSKSREELDLGGQSVVTSANYDYHKPAKPDSCAFYVIIKTDNFENR